jgi:hexosaminidase
MTLKLTASFYFIVAILLVSCAQKESLTPAKVAIIPKPASVAESRGAFVIAFVIDKTTTIDAEGEALAVGDYLAKLIGKSSAFEPSVNTKSDGRKITMKIVEDNSGSAYELSVNENEIVIKASSKEGLFYGTQTLRQLFPAAFESENEKGTSWSIPSVEIKDKPRFAWRGMHIDVSRHFFSVEFLKTFIDRLALYKFNKLHLHLTDDQGWRLQIKKYPQLTDNGAWRELNNQDSVCIKMSATNPDLALPSEHFKQTSDGRKYGGFYTQDEVKELVNYASERFITIVPEIDMPGHMSAAIGEFPELTCVDAGGWGKIFSVPLCPCEETTYEFIDNVVKEVAEIFPGEYIHIGADEVDERTWRESTACKNFLREKKMKVETLHSYFVNRVNAIVNRYGKKTIGWDEIMDGNSDSSIAVMYWRGWVPDAPLKAAERGHKVIMSPTSHCYFDYEPDNNSLRHMYDFQPVPGDLPLNDQDHIIGLQANIWTEFIPTTSRLDYMTMPRMIALAEVGWSEERDWDNFTSRVKEHHARWDALDIKYRLPDVEGLAAHKVFIDTITFKPSIPFGVNELRYTTDGSEPNANSKLYESPFVIDSSVVIKTLSLGHNGRCGNRKDFHLEKQSYLKSVAATDTTSGVKCEYFEKSFSSVKQIDEQTPTKTAIVSKVAFPSFKRAEIFGLKFTGLIEVGADDIYTFYLSSDDGSSLTIGDRLVINNDGAHSEKEVAGEIALQKGMHPFVIRYFDGGGGNSLKFVIGGSKIQEPTFKIVK